MQAALDAANVGTQAGVHRHLREEVSTRTAPLLAKLLVVGFNATHWPLWDLLQAVTCSAAEVTVALIQPRVFAEAIDQLWISSWEEFAGSEAVVPDAADENPTPFAALVDSYEQGVPGALGEAELGFLVTPDLASQIRAVVLQAVDFLQRDSCTRLGIIFAEANALALGVASELRRLGILLDDSIGCTEPGLFERRSWQSWLALQEEAGVGRLIAWLRACEAEGVACGMPEGATARDVAGVLNNALGESLVDDLHFLSVHLENSRDSRVGHVADFLRRRIALPKRASFDRFLALTRQATALPGWENHLARLQMNPPAWLGQGDRMLSRRAFLEWLKEATASQAWTSGPDGNHFYGKVHLLIYAQMSGQTWSHLILTGLNEGVWPHVFEAGAFGSRHELTELNRQARALNLRSAAQGGQGIGHDVVRARHGHILLPLERQDLALRDLCAALESTSHAACLTALATESGRGLLPNDFFIHAWQAKTGAVLDEETFRRLANSTAAWTQQHEALFAKAPTITTPAPAEDLADLPLFARATAAPPAPVTATTTAYLARRDRAQPFGPYEFAHGQPPAHAIQLSCKRWEDAWNHPATVWLEDIVGAAPWPDGTLSWQRAVGTWTHRWLAAALRKWQEEKAAPAELAVMIWDSAAREADAIHRRAREVGIDLYPWWEQLWAQARGVTLGLGETLAPYLADRPFLCEFKLPPDLLIALPGMSHADFLLRGRLDLLLLDPGAELPDAKKPDLVRRTCWVIDFKTGSAQNLNPKKVSEGKGLQTVLYALATQALGANATSVSLHTVEAPLKPQIDVDKIEEIAPLFRSLEIFHRNGIFGMRPDAENIYGYAPGYPIATRFVPGDILKAKWTLVHGGAPAGGEAE
jgi:hypothetical protein